MERNTIEEALNERIGSTSMESYQTGGFSNEELWLKIKNEIPTRKVVAFDFKKKIIVGIALSLSLAGVAMYSGFTYYEYKQKEPIKTNVVSTRQQPIETKEELIEVVEEIKEEKIEKVANAQTTPKITEQPSKDILVAESDIKSALDTTLVDTVSSSKTEIIESANENIQAKADTVTKEVKTIYMKPAPVQVQAKKVKYVKKKKNSKK